MPDPNWREVVAAETRRQRELRDEIASSARRRAAAFADGVHELGTKSAVARETGVDLRTIRRSINEYGTATATPPGSPTTTE